MTNVKGVKFLALAAVAAASASSVAKAQSPAEKYAWRPPESKCEAQRTPRSALKVVKVEPRLGDKLTGYPKSGFDIMTASAQFYPAYEVAYSGIRYTVAANRQKVIKWVDTKDPAFRTPEGVASGDTLAKVLEASKSEVIREPGWAFYVTLPSGWAAAFAQGESMTEGELPPSAKVCWLFKRE